MTPIGNPSKNTVVPPNIFIPLKHHLQHAGGEGTGQGLNGEGGGSGDTKIGKKRKKEAKRQGKEEDEE